MKKVFLSLLAMLLLSSELALAQAYPQTNPTYVPNAIAPATTLAAAGNAVFNTQNIGTAVCRLSGTNTAVVGTFQGTTTVAAAAGSTWTSLRAFTVGGAEVLNVTGNGVYRLNSAGFAQVRFNLVSIGSGSLVVNCSGNGAQGVAQIIPARRASYSAAATIAPAAAATDMLVLVGSATKTVRVVRAECSGTATAAEIDTLVVLKRSVADTGGTATNPTKVPYDAASAAASATVALYSANPTTGTLVGNLSQRPTVLGKADGTGLAPGFVVWQFGEGNLEEVVLSGIAQSFAINAGGVTFGAGASIKCNLVWTEE